MNTIQHPVHIFFKQAFRTLVLASPVLLIGIACGDSADGGSSCAESGGPVSGEKDMHCGARIQTVSESACMPGDAGVSADAGDSHEGGDEYGETIYNNEGDDDECKYRVKWSSTPICKDANVTFTVVASNKATNSPLTGAEPSAEVFLNATHPAPNTDQTVTEDPPGTYKIGPVRFDASGTWTVRFHFFEMCTDSPPSPHGHIAFFVNVP